MLHEIITCSCICSVNSLYLESFTNGLPKELCKQMEIIFFHQFFFRQIFIDISCRFSFSSSVIPSVLLDWFSQRCNLLFHLLGITNQYDFPISSYSLYLLRYLMLLMSSVVFNFRVRVTEKQKVTSLIFWKEAKEADKRKGKSGVEVAQQVHPSLLPTKERFTWEACFKSLFFFFVIQTWWFYWALLPSLSFILIRVLPTLTCHHLRCQ